jgi:hypothetical protein
MGRIVLTAAEEPDYTEPPYQLLLTSGEFAYGDVGERRRIGVALLPRDDVGRTFQWRDEGARVDPGSMEELGNADDEERYEAADWRLLAEKWAYFVDHCRGEPLDRASLDAAARTLQRWDARGYALLVHWSSSSSSSRWSAWLPGGQQPQTIDQVRRLWSLLNELFATQSWRNAMHTVGYPATAATALNEFVSLRGAPLVRTDADASARAAASTSVHLFALRRWARAVCVVRDRHISVFQEHDLDGEQADQGGIFFGDPVGESTTTRRSLSLKRAALDYYRRKYAEPEPEREQALRALFSYTSVSAVLELERSWRQVMVTVLDENGNDVDAASRATTTIVLATTTNDLMLFEYDDEEQRLSFASMFQNKAATAARTYPTAIANSAGDDEAARFIVGHANGSIAEFAYDHTRKRLSRLASPRRIRDARGAPILALAANEDNIWYATAAGVFRAQKSPSADGGVVVTTLQETRGDDDIDAATIGVQYRGVVAWALISRRRRRVLLGGIEENLDDGETTRRIENRIEGVLCVQCRLAYNDVTLYVEKALREANEDRSSWVARLLVRGQPDRLLTRFVDGALGEPRESKFDRDLAMPTTKGGAIAFDIGEVASDDDDDDDDDDDGIGSGVVITVTEQMAYKDVPLAVLENPH